MPSSAIDGKSCKTISAKKAYNGVEQAFDDVKTRKRLTVMNENFISRRGREKFTSKDNS